MKLILSLAGLVSTDEAFDQRLPECHRQGRVAKDPLDDGAADLSHPAGHHYNVRLDDHGGRPTQQTHSGQGKGLCKEKKFKKSEITMEVGGWVQVSLGFCCWKIVPK